MRYNTISVLTLLLDSWRKLCSVAMGVCLGRSVDELSGGDDSVFWAREVPAIDILVVLELVNLAEETVNESVAAMSNSADAPKIKAEN